MVAILCVRGVCSPEKKHIFFPVSTLLLRTHTRPYFRRYCLFCITIFMLFVEISETCVVQNAIPPPHKRPTTSEVLARRLHLYLYDVTMSSSGGWPLFHAEYINKSQITGVFSFALIFFLAVVDIYK